MVFIIVGLLLLFCTPQYGYSYTSLIPPSSYQCRSDGRPEPMHISTVYCANELKGREKTARKIQRSRQKSTNKHIIFLARSSRRRFYVFVFVPGVIQMPAVFFKQAYIPYIHITAINHFFSLFQAPLYLKIFGNTECLGMIPHLCIWYGIVAWRLAVKAIHSNKTISIRPILTEYFCIWCLCMYRRVRAHMWKILLVIKIIPKMTIKQLSFCSWLQPNVQKTVCTREKVIIGNGNGSAIQFRRRMNEIKTVCLVVARFGHGYFNTCVPIKYQEEHRVIIRIKQRVMQIYFIELCVQAWQLYIYIHVFRLFFL